MNGGWQIRYLDFDNSEDEIGMSIFHDMLSLKATEDEAVKAEAKEVWGKMTSPGNTHMGWDGNIYPRAPCLVYEVDLSEWNPEEVSRIVAEVY